MAHNQNRCKLVPVYVGINTSEVLSDMRLPHGPDKIMTNKYPPEVQACGKSNVQPRPILNCCHPEVGKGGRM